VKSDSFILFIVSLVVILTLAITVFSFLLVLQKRKHKYVQDKANLIIAYERTSLQAQLEIQEETFKNISQEIHDNIGQTLSFIKLNLNTLHLVENKVAEDTLTEITGALTKVIQDLRDLSKSLNPDFIIYHGLTGSIQQQLNLLEKTGTFRTNMNVTGEAFRLPVNTELIVFRIIQELLNNIVKHSGATSIDVNVHSGDDRLIISIQDNGDGFDNQRLKACENEHKGIGLRNILSRTSFLGGQIDFEKLPQSPGSVVRVDIGVES
jgi:signal transduction histidine kinase